MFGLSHLPGSFIRFTTFSKARILLIWNKVNIAPSAAGVGRDGWTVPVEPARPQKFALRAVRQIPLRGWQD
jgi:hypothetical protein